MSTFVDGGECGVEERRVTLRVGAHDGDIARLEDFSFSRLRISAADRDRHEQLFRGVSFDDVAVDAP